MNADRRRPGGPRPARIALVPDAFIAAVVALAAAGALVAPSIARGQSPDGATRVAAQILPSVRSIRPGEPFDVAIRLVVPSGWHIYWKNPGEIGVPTAVEWDLPAGFRVGPIRWPHPRREVVDGGLVTHVLDDDEVVLTATVRPPGGLTDGETATVAVDLRWGVCRDVCVPERTRLSIPLPVDRRSPQPHPRGSAVAATAASRTARTLPEWGLRASRDGDDVRIRLEPPAGRSTPRGPLVFFPDAPGQPATVATLDRTDDGAATVRIPVEGTARDAAGWLRGVLVAASGWDPAGRHRAARIELPVADERASGGHDRTRR